MKKFIQWLARVFDAEITVEKIVEVDKIVEKKVYLPPYGGTVQGDVYVEGDILATGRIGAQGDVACKMQVNS